MNPQEMVGKKFGSVTVLKYIGKLHPQIYMFSCRCDCGREYSYQCYSFHNPLIAPQCETCRVDKLKKIEYKGEKYLLKDLAEKLNIKLGALKSRIYRCHWREDRWAEPKQR